MGILALNVGVTGLVGDTVNPRLNTMVTTDNLAKITTAGYLNNQNVNGNPILPTDVFNIWYSFNALTQKGTFGIFTVSYSVSTGYSLVSWANPGDVLLPVVSGDFANFNGTSGQIKDAGYSPTNAAKTKVVMLNASPTVSHVAIFTAADGTIGDGGVLGTAAAKAASNNSLSTVASTAGSGFTAGHIVTAADAAGTIQDSGIVSTNVVVNNAVNTMTSASNIILGKANGTETTNAVTASAQSGVITTSALTTAGGASYAITWTNTFITTSSVILLTIMGGTNTTENVTLTATAGAGTSTLTIYNNTAATALNGTILIGYLVV
jgi:hypothetical protein